MKLQSSLLICLLVLILSPATLSQSKTVVQLKGELVLEDAKDNILAHKFLADGRLLLVTRRTVRLVDPSSGKLLESRPIDTGDFCEDSDRMINPDGRRMLVFGNRGCASKKDKIKRPPAIWNLQTGKQIAVLDTSAKPIRVARWSKNGKVLITSSDKYNPNFSDSTSVEVSFWDGETFAFKNSLPADKVNWWYLTNDGDKCFYSVAPIKNFFYIDRYIGETGGPVRVWDTNTGRIEQTIMVSDGNVQRKISGIEVSPDEKYLTFVTQPPKSKDSERRLAVWEIDKSRYPKYEVKPTYEITPTPKMPSYRVTFSPDGKFFALDSGKNIQIYQTSNGEKFSELLSVENVPTHWLDDDKILLFVYGDKMEALETATGKRLYQQTVLFVEGQSSDTEGAIYTYVSDSTTIVVHPDRDLLLGFSAQLVKVYDSRTGEPLQSLVSPPMDYSKKKPRVSDKELVSKADWSPDGKTLYVINYDKNSISLWRLAEQ